MAWLVVWVVYVVIAPGLAPAPRPAPPADLDGLRYLGSNDTHVRSRLPARFVLDRRALVVLAGSSCWSRSRRRPSLFLLLAVRSGWPPSVATRRRTLAAVVLPAVADHRVHRARATRHRRPLPAARCVALWLVAAGRSSRSSPPTQAGAGAAPAVALVLVVAVSAFFTIGSDPHSIAWTTPPFRPGYRVASNSDVDWGQDFYRLLDWSQGKRPAVAYFGPRGISLRRRARRHVLRRDATVAADGDGSRFRPPS